MIRKRKAIDTNNDEPGAKCSKPSVPDAEKDCQDRASSAPLSVRFNTGKTVEWKRIRSENLNLDYCIAMNKTVAKCLYDICERELEYNTGRIAQVQIFGKWIDIPRKQVIHVITVPI